MRGWPVVLVSAMLATAAIGIAAIVFATRDGSTSIFDLEVGDCFVLPGPDAELDADATFGIELVDVIHCSEPHDAEVVATGRLNPGRDRAYPSDDELFAEIDRSCAAADLGDAGGFGLVPVAPNAASWEPFEGGYICLAVPFGGDLVTGSITDR
jgi:hypothetical protein